MIRDSEKLFQIKLTLENSSCLGEVTGGSIIFSFQYFKKLTVYPFEKLVHSVYV